jgi:hypothetical protein
VLDGAAASAGPFSVIQFTTRVHVDAPFPLLNDEKVKARMNLQFMESTLRNTRYNRDVSLQCATCNWRV